MTTVPPEVDVDEDDTDLLIVTTTEKAATGKAVRIKLDDTVLVAHRPKESMMALTAGTVSNKYASESQLARAAFDFLRAALDRESWRHVEARIQDNEDDFDTDSLADVFEHLFAAFSAEMKADEQRPANRAARRGNARRG